MDMTVAGVSAVALTVALVEVAKRALHLDQQQTVIATVAIAQLLAAGAYLAVRYPGFSDAWTAIVAGLGVALVAMGSYSGGKAVRGK